MKNLFECKTVEDVKGIFIERKYKREQNLSRMIGQKIKQYFYDDAGLVFITNDYQFDMNFIKGLEGKVSTLKGSTITAIDYEGNGIRIDTEKKGIEQTIKVLRPMEVIIT